MNHSRYRPDIDGLRAIAVISVLFFHLDIKIFGGGFIGVDVFFVISGFLITRLIRDEFLEKKSFSFFKFYVRRARRLLPSLFFTLSLCFVFSYLLFAPQHFERFGGSLLHAVFSISNFYFWSESGYFNTASDFKPLLHTWSLSIEEQFYMVWPLLLVFFLKRTPKYATPAILVIIAFFSLFLNQVFADGLSAVFIWFSPTIAERFSDGPSTIFFLAPFRVFEFSIGAIVVWLIRFQPKSRIALEPLVLVGLGLIAYPVFTYTKDITFPSYNALLPCMGTALIIYSGTAKFSGKLLNNRLAVNIGLISYSLYLIHWPLIVFCKYWKINELTSVNKFVILVVSIVFASLMYRFIEQPFRSAAPSRPLAEKRFVLYCIMLSMLLVLLAAHVWTNNGWIWRFPQELINQLSLKKDHFDKYVWLRHNKLERDFAYNGKPKILVIGDSMAADFVNVLAEGNNIEKFDLVTIPLRNHCIGTFPLPGKLTQVYLDIDKSDPCKEQSESIMKNHLLKEADSVVLASGWQPWHVDLIDSTVKFLTEIGVPQVAIVGIKIQSIDGVKFIAKYALRKTAHKLRTPLSADVKKINEKIKRLNSDVLFINLLDYFCNDVGCQRITDSGHLLIFDLAHLTSEGAKVIGSRATESDWMSSLASTIKN